MKKKQPFTKTIYLGSKRYKLTMLEDRKNLKFDFNQAIEEDNIISKYSLKEITMNDHKKLFMEYCPNPDLVQSAYDTIDGGQLENLFFASSLILGNSNQNQQGSLFQEKNILAGDITLDDNLVDEAFLKGSAGYYTELLFNILSSNKDIQEKNLFFKNLVLHPTHQTMTFPDCLLGDIPFELKSSNKSSGIQQNYIFMALGTAILDYLHVMDIDLSSLNGIDVKGIKDKLKEYTLFNYLISTTPGRSFSSNMRASLTNDPYKTMELRSLVCIGNYKVEGNKILFNNFEVAPFIDALIFSLNKDGEYVFSGKRGYFSPSYSNDKILIKINKNNKTFFIDTLTELKPQFFEIIFNYITTHNYKGPFKDEEINILLNFVKFLRNEVPQETIDSELENSFEEI